MISSLVTRTSAALRATGGFRQRRTVPRQRPRHGAGATGAERLRRALVFAVPAIVPAIVLAMVYVALLFRGPFDQVGSA